MRALIYISTAMILIVALWFFSYEYIENNSLSFINTLNKINETIENDNWKSAQDKITKLNKDWDNIKHKWGMILDHTEIDDIDLIIAKINKSIELKNKHVVLEEIEVLKYLFIMINEKENLTLTNIL